MRPVRAHKTLCVRFHLNDYSVPPQALARALTLVASPTTVRLLDGSTEIASHHRSFDRHQLLEDPARRQALLEKNATLRAPPPEAASPLWCQKVRPSFRPPSSAVNLPPGSPTWHGLVFGTRVSLHLTLFSTDRFSRDVPAWRAWHCACQ
jgi:hypothetical protein